jgi:hypothetical protein
LDSGLRRNDDLIRGSLDIKALDVIVRSFNFVLDNHQNIPIMEDHTLDSVDQLRSVTDKLQSLQRFSEETVTIPMNFSDWVACTSYIEYAKLTFLMKRMEPFLNIWQTRMKVLIHLASQWYWGNIYSIYHLRNLNKAAQISTLCSFFQRDG